MTSKVPFHRITIFGPGLLGGSIALAVRDYLPSCELNLWARRDQPLQLAQDMGITSQTFRDPIKAAEGAELIILATPIGAFEDLARHILPAISPSTIVTDVGSVKDYVHRTTGAFLTERGRLFIGSHPMAGAETQGLENAYPTLLQGATVAITNPHSVHEERVKQLESFWQALGSTTYRMEPRNHDQAVARISHMPHIMAALCARNSTAGSPPLSDLKRLKYHGFSRYDTSKLRRSSYVGRHSLGE